MTYDTYETIAIVFLSICGIMLIVSILLFLKFKIMSVFGDLTGRTAKKQIEHFRDNNLKSGDKKFKPSPANFNRGKLTDTMTGSIGKGRKTGRFGKTGSFGKTGNTYNPISKKENNTPITSEINTKNIPTDVLLTKNQLSEQFNVSSNETDVLEIATDVLNKTAGLNETETLDVQTDVLDSGTEVLSNGIEIFNSGTEVLNSGTEVLGITGELSNANNTQFSIIRSIMLIHTEEVI